MLCKIMADSAAENVLTAVGFICIWRKTRDVKASGLVKNILVVQALCLVHTMEESKAGYAGADHRKKRTYACSGGDKDGGLL